MIGLVVVSGFSVFWSFMRANDITVIIAIMTERRPEEERRVSQGSRILPSEWQLRRGPRGAARTCWWAEGIRSLSGTHAPATFPLLNQPAPGLGCWPEAERPSWQQVGQRAPRTSLSPWVSVLEQNVPSIPVFPWICTLHGGRDTPSGHCPEKGCGWQEQPVGRPLLRHCPVLS